MLYFNVRKIPVSKGKYHALVDDEDYPVLSRYMWQVMKTRKANTKFYAFTEMRTPYGKRMRVTMHKFIMNPRWGKQVDHRNHDGLDNQKVNLRVCTNKENCRNKLKRRGTTSRFKGVSWHRENNCWQVQVTFSGRSVYLGKFKDERDAARAYNDAAREYFGEYANLNPV